MTLDINFDFESIKYEVLKNNVWYDYHPPYFELTPFLKELHNSYKHCALTTIHKFKSSSIVREHFARWKNEEKTVLEEYYSWPLEDQKWYYTEVAERFPILLNLINSITDKPLMAKIVKSEGGHSLGWHSHQNDPLIKKYNTPEQCILHIPIITNSKVVHIVTKEVHEDRYHFKDLEYYQNDSRYFVENLSIKKIWFLNSYHQHSYKNYSNEHRFDVLIYNDTRDNPKLEKLIEKSISSYNGNFL